MKNLIFDCGGVMVYPRLGEWNLPFGAAEILGTRARDLYTSRYLEAYRRSCGWLDESRLVESVEEERRLRREFIRSIDDFMEWNLSQSEIARLTDDFTDNIRRFGFFGDVEPWLAHWKERFRLGMLSDAMPSLLGFLEQYGILGLFDAAVISTHVGATKPDRRMYEAILSSMNALPGDCLFVDDRINNLEGAAAMGMRAVQMARSAFPPKALWEGPVVHDFDELNGWIEA